MYAEKVIERELIAACADVSRSRFSKPFAKLSVAMEEPSPVVACGQTIGQLHLVWDTSSEAQDDFELGKRRVEIEYQLQSRTRYGTRVVKEGEDSIGDDSGSHEQSANTHLGTFEVCATDRNDVRAVDSRDGSRAYTGTIPILVQIAEGTVPTFSHVLASRDYALLVKAKVQGLQHKELSLKVPLQVCESSAADNALLIKVKVQGLQHKALSLKVPLQVCESSAAVKDESFRAKSEVYAKMGLSDVSDAIPPVWLRMLAIVVANDSQILPTYEDHRYSLLP
jgi:hypothetical protein